MPLSKLFPKRNSIKSTKIAHDSSQDKKVTDEKEFVPNMSSDDADVQEHIGSNVINKVVETNTQLYAEIGETAQQTHNNSKAEPEQNNQTSACSKDSTSGVNNPSDSVHGNTEVIKSTKNKVRSQSFREDEPKSTPVKSGRRKCDSESGIYSVCPNEERIGDKIIQLREKDLEKVIGQYVDRLIRESIHASVRSASINKLYEEMTADVSDHRLSESSDITDCTATIEQKLHSDRVTEYAKLTFHDETVNDDTEFDPNCLGKDNSNASDTEETKEESIGGYCSDCEESVTLHSIESQSELIDDNDSKIIYLNPETVTDKDIDSKMPKTNPVTVSVVEDGKCHHGATADIKSLSETDLVEEKEELHKFNLNAEEKEVTESESELDYLIIMNVEDDSQLKAKTKFAESGQVISGGDLGENLPEHHTPDDEKKINWKMGYLHVKLPHKSRGKGHLKVWKKRCVAIQPDEFANDPKNHCLMISVYSGESGTARKHSASFWKSVSCDKAVVYRSSSRTHRYAFTVSDDNAVIVHLAADSEAASQDWMAAMRSILWPPSPVIQLEKMLNGREFDVSIIDNDFSYRAGLLGMYGYLTITPKKLILVHPHQGYVIQEWYLNTVDKFQLIHQSRIEDVHKVLAMTTCSDSSTGKGEMMIYCREALALLQSLASTIHQILTHHSKQEGGKYQKELEEIAEWLVPATAEATDDKAAAAEDYYKVPPRQVKSLLDIPNFIFDKTVSPVASVACSSGTTMESELKPTLQSSRTNPITVSQDSGISAGNSTDDFLNCSTTSFIVGGGSLPGKSSDSELSDSYTPPRSPNVKAKNRECRKGEEAPEILEI